MADQLGREAGAPSQRTAHPAWLSEEGRTAAAHLRMQDDDDGRDYEGEVEANERALHGDGEDVMTMGTKGW
jgi:hypothetical protein